MLRIEYLPIGDIKPYKRNAKKHPPAQVEQIAESIRQSVGYHMVLNRRCLTLSDKTKPATGSRW